FLGRGRLPWSPVGGPGQVGMEREQPGSRLVVGQHRKACLLALGDGGIILNVTEKSTRIENSPSRLRTRMGLDGMVRLDIIRHVLWRPATRHCSNSRYWV